MLNIACWHTDRVAATTREKRSHGYGSMPSFTATMMTTAVTMEITMELRNNKSAAILLNHQLQFLNSMLLLTKENQV